MARSSRTIYRAGAATSTTSEPSGTLRSLRVYPAFRTLLLGTLATNSAFWMYQVAVGWLALQMTDSPFFVGLTGFASGIPLLLLSLPAGVVVDRFDRRAVLRVAQYGVMVVSGIFALLVATDLIERWSILVLAACYGTVMSFIFPTRTTIVPSLVERSDLANAIALNAACQNATRVVGPALAGALIAAIGVSGTFAVAALMQIGALATTARLPASAAGATNRGGARLNSLTVGLRIVAHEPFLTALIFLALAANVLVMPYINLMPVFARDELGMGSGGLGVLLASTGLGTVAGALSVARSQQLGTSPVAQVLTAAGFAVLILIFALVRSVPLAVLLLFAAGCMSACFLAINQTAMQMRCSEETRGRVLSIYMLTWGVLPIGQLIVGTLADQIGAPSATAVACCIAIGCIALVVWRFRLLGGSLD